MADSDTSGLSAASSVTGTDIVAIVKSGVDYRATMTQVSSFVNAAGAPVGGVIMWPTNSAPSGWLLCYGQAVSRTTYAALYAVIGTTFGSGDGSTTFNLPDWRGRMPLGQDDMGGSSANRVTDSQADSIGGTGGTETHTLTTAEMPSHGHDLRSRTSGGTGGSPYYPGYVSGYTTTDAFSTAGNAVANTGGGGAHNNMPPWLTINYIIYAGA